MMLKDTYRFSELRQEYPELHTGLRALRQTSNGTEYVIPQEEDYITADEKVYWHCKNCGSYWIASLRERVNGKKCSICSRSMNKVSTPSVEWPDDL